MIQLSQLVPVNYQAEKVKFFTDHTYNPQFIYPGSISSSDLVYYGLPKPAVTEKAERIVVSNLPYQLIKISEKKLDPFLSPNDILLQTEAYLKKTGIIDRYQINWSSKAIARCSIKSHEILFRVGADYTEHTLNGVLNHEIGTHALRRLNDEKQPWHDKRKLLGFKNSLLTEEGLATLHQHMDDEIPVLFGAALRYLAVDIAQSSSFAMTWHQLRKYFQDDEKLWTTVFRVKRGIKNTENPGGFTKDLVYFEGAYTVANWLVETDYAVKKLYLGRISTDDVTKAESITPLSEPILPIFLIHSPEAYREKIAGIMKENELRN
ncbi:DUF1704 domain-containing protein [Candidatus Woesebacteria bacterium]|nr:DUF1704 domain-containing protein [Candidatus Woesebacteria bacterium]